MGDVVGPVGLAERGQGTAERDALFLCSKGPEAQALTQQGLAHQHQGKGLTESIWAVESSAELGSTDLMPSTGLCRERRARGCPGLVTKLGRRLLRPLLDADKPPAAPVLRRAMALIDKSINDYLINARPRFGCCLKLVTRSRLGFPE